MTTAVSMGVHLHKVAIAASMAAIYGSASALPIALPSGSIIPGTVWEVTYAAPITLEFDAGDTTNNTVGTIIETTIRTTINPLTINFLQVFEAPSSASTSAGLRLNFQERVTNLSSIPWVHYELSLVDVVTGPDNVLNTGDHPPPPHFHQTSQIAKTAAQFAFEGTLAFSGNDLDKYTATFLGMPQTDPSNDLILGDGSAVVDITKNLEVSSLLIHERQFGLCPQFTDSGAPLPCLNDPARRQFLLVETPTPTSGTLALMLAGGLAFLSMRMMRRRRVAVRVIA